MIYYMLRQPLYIDQSRSLWRKKRVWKTGIIWFRSPAALMLPFWCVMFCQLLLIIWACIDSNSALTVCWIAAMTLCQVSSLSIQPLMSFFVCWARCSFEPQQRLCHCHKMPLLRHKVQNNLRHRRQKWQFIVSLWGFLVLLWSSFLVGVSVVCVCVAMNAQFFFSFWDVNKWKNHFSPSGCCGEQTGR